MSWWPLPPCTGEVPSDETWAFVGEKPHDCDPEGPDDDRMGDYWDHVAYGPERRPVLAAIPGARSIENAGAIVGEVEQRLGGETPGLMTGDEDPAYEPAIERAFGEPTLPGRGPGRPRIEPERRLPEGLTYATVHKHREGHRAVAVDLGDPGRVGGGPGGVGGRRGREHLVPGAAERGRPWPQREGGPQDLSPQRGLAGARGDDVPDDVRLQLLLGGADAAGRGGRGPLARPVTDDGGGPGGSHLDLEGVVHPPRSSISVGHYPHRARRNKAKAEEGTWLTLLACSPFLGPAVMRIIGVFVPYPSAPSVLLREAHTSRKWRRIQPVSCTPTNCAGVPY